MAQSIIDEDLSDGTASCETKDVFVNRRMPVEKCKGRRELISVGEREAEEGGNRAACKERGNDKIACRQESREEILGDHHLRARVGAVGTENVVLSAVRETVKKKIDAQEKQSP